VFLILTSLFVAMAPLASASHTTQYGVQRDPLHISIGDLNCDGHNDIASGSGMGHFISFLYNDGSGGFGDRQDVLISNNDSFRAGFRDVADGNRLEIADVDGDEVNDVIYYQQNARFTDESFVRPANLTVLKGECDKRVNGWEEMFETITVINPYLSDFDVGDITDDGYADVVFVSTDSTFANQFIQIYKGPDYTLPSNQHAPISVPLTNGYYTAAMFGNWNEDLQTNPVTGDPLPGECEDLDIWLLRTPPFNAGVGYSRGTFDNMTVLEYDCLTGTYPNPMDPTSTGTMHDFKLDVEHDYELFGIDIADTTPDDDTNEIDLIVAVDGITGNLTYATKSGGNWDTQNYVPYGNYMGASVTISDVNRDGEVDFFVPTSITLLDTQESTVQNQTYLLRPNLRALNTVQILLADPNGEGYLSPLSFDVGRRPTMAVPGQLQGGDSSALEVVIGQADYTYRFSNNAMWLDTMGYAGQGDYLSVLALDNYDQGITRVTIEPSVMDPATFQSIVGEGNRWVNVTVKNTGLMPIASGSVDVDLEVREVLGGTDTVVYHNDFESESANINLAGAHFQKYSYTGEYSAGNSSWHIDEDRFWVNGTTYYEGDVVHFNNSDYQCGHNGTSSCSTVPDEDNESWDEVAYLLWEARQNPTNFFWAGVDHLEADGNYSTGYYNHMDEALILEDVDLSGANAAFLDLDAICSAGFFQLFLAEPYDVIERWLYEDSCSIEVWSAGTGWEPVWRYGGWDNERKYRIEERVSSSPDPEYNDYNGDFYGDWQSSLWNNYTESGGIRESCALYYLYYVICWDDGELDQRANSIDLTPYAGEVIDIRFRFRSGLEGSVGPVGAADFSGLDGFAFDNITIRKRDVSFGDSTVESQTLTLSDAAAGESQTVQLTADFVDNTTYYVSVTLSDPSGYTDQDDTNDQSRFQLTVRNLYDPGLIEGPWLDLVNGELYASGERDITIGVQNWGNTVVDFEVEAKVFNALPRLIAAEDFYSASGSGLSMWEDDENENGSRLDDSSGSNEMLPQNQGVFKNQAYWLGHPSEGYGDNWNETMTLEPIAISDGSDGHPQPDFTFLTFDYFAEGDHIADRNGNVQAVRDFSYLEASWVRDGEVYQGVIYGSWTDLNANGLRPGYNGVSNTYFHYCEDFDQNGLYEEVEYAGDHSGGVGQDGWVQWFDSEDMVGTARIDLTHVHLLNTTSPDSFAWTDECTTLAGSDVTFTWRFYSNDDGVNGNAGFAGFAIDNIRVDDYTFTDDGNYTESVTGMDAAHRRTINMGTHDFVNGLYRIDLMTLYDNTDNTSNWFGKPEMSVANNVSTILFGIANADITLLQPDVMDCVTDTIYECVYASNPSGQASHSFSVPLLNGVIEGTYVLTMKIIDEDTGQTVYEQVSENGPFLLDPHQRGQANWTYPYNQWFDGHNYNISFYATLGEDGEESGNERFFEIEFYDHVDIAIFSDPTDQSRLQRVKTDLQAMDKTYTQFEVNDWNAYGTEDWLEHYSKVLLPWQTDYNVEYGDYYELLGTPNPRNSGLTLTETLVDYMHDGGTVQVHLGPYRSEYLSLGADPERLPFDMDIVMRDYVNLTVDRRIQSNNLTFVDPFHPIMSGINTSAFAGVNGGSHVALSGLDTNQVNADNLPLACSDAPPGESEGGRVSDGGTFHTLIRDSANPSQSLLSVCNHYLGGLIVTTIDVENPTVSQSYGDTNFPLLSNMLDFHLTPYPNGFEIAGEGFEITIDGQIQPIDVLTAAYERKAIESNASLQFGFETNVGGIFADWTIESANNETVTGWDGQTLGDDNWHVHQDDSTNSINATFCVPDIGADLGCKIDAEWKIWLYLHDAAGHTRITNVSVYTNDIAADDSAPVAQIDIVQDEISTEFLEFIGSQPTPTGDQDSDGNWVMIDSPKYRVRLTETGTTDIKFSAANSSDIGTGIKTYTWSVSGDGNQDHQTILPKSQSDWHYTFSNVTPNNNPIMLELVVTDQRNLDSTPPFRIFFEVVGELFGDEEPEVEMDSISTAEGHRFDALDAVEILNITGVVVDSDEGDECDVTVEVALDDTSIFDKGEATKTTQKDLGRYDRQSGLCDGDSYELSLNISHLYIEGDGNAGLVYIRITEGSYVVNDQIQLYTLPKQIDPCVADPDSCADDSSGAMGMVVMGGIAAIILFLVVLVTLLVRSRGRAPEGDSVESFGGVEQMDPVEAYVQQLLAQGYDEQTARQYAHIETYVQQLITQGYDEQTARQYAQQYYAQYYAQQKGGGG